MRAGRHYLLGLLLLLVLAAVVAIRYGAPELEPEPAAPALPAKIQPCQKSEEGARSDLYDELRRLRASRGTPEDEVDLLNVIGLTHQDEAALLSARALAEAIGDQVREGRSLNHLGVVAKNRGKLGQALDLYDQALDKYDQALLQRKAPEALPRKATLLQNLGDAYLTLNRLPEAQDFLEQSLGMREELGWWEGGARTLAILGQVHTWQGNLEAGLLRYLMALKLARETASCLDDAEVLDKIGTVYQEQGKLREAAAVFQEAADVYEEEENKRFLAWTTANLGQVLNLQRRPGKALKQHQRAFELAEEVSDRGAKAYSLYGQAQAERQLGNLEKAHEHIAKAVGLLESLREGAPGFSLRETYFSPLRTYYELQADMLMEMQGRDSGRDWDDLALEATERYRSRSFLDTLAESSAEFRRSVPPDLLRRERQLQQRINSTEKRLSDRSLPERQRAALERELRTNLLEFDKLQASIREQSPALEKGNRPVPLKVHQMQGELDEQTVLLVYFLGEERSFLWRIDPQSVRSFHLPPRRQIERQARDAWAFLSRTNASASGEKMLADLSRTLLGPLAGDLGPHRLAVVPDGALRMIPFSVLPVPEGHPAAGKPLIQEREVVHIESPSVLSLLRSQVEGRPQQQLEVAGVFDAVFGPPDLRLSEAARTRGALFPGGSGLALSRLKHSRREADVLRSLVPPDRIVTALDFAATRELVLDGRLGGARIVHIATHGILHPVHPELSGLVFSRIDEQGKEREGFVYAYEIFGLDLPADLVVLSACRTLPDPTSRGQGLVSMTRGFMVAGAPRVIYSLWSVNDRSTAELMKRFYRAHFEDGLRPAAALRQAQIAMLKESKWQEPYYWAPFVFEGDWR